MAPHAYKTLTLFFKFKKDLFKSPRTLMVRQRSKQMSSSAAARLEASQDRKREGDALFGRGSYEQAAAVYRDAGALLDGPACTVPGLRGARCSRAVRAGARCRWVGVALTAAAVCLSAIEQTPTKMRGKRVSCA
jgi:hypothetical protein